MSKFHEMDQALNRKPTAIDVASVKIGLELWISSAQSATCTINKYYNGVSLSGRYGPITRP